MFQFLLKYFCSLAVCFPMAIADKRIIYNLGKVALIWLQRMKKI